MDKMHSRKLQIPARSAVPAAGRTAHTIIESSMEMFAVRAGVCGTGHNTHTHSANVYKKHKNVIFLIVALPLFGAIMNRKRRGGCDIAQKRDAGFFECCNIL